ncbi:MAG: phosphatidylserine decarboxylase [Gammaproteobacteria bacterium]
MAANRYPLIAREGWLSIFLAAGAAMAVFLEFGALWSLPLWALALLLLLMFRDPARDVSATPLAVVSPADGRIQTVETVRDPYIDRDAQRITIRMHPYGVFSTRSPAEGRMLEPRRADADGRPLPHGVWLQTDEGDDLVIVMNRGPLRNPPRCYVRFGERVGQGQRCGFITLGSTIELYLPASSRVKVRPGDRVHAGADVIAQLVHKTSS